MEWQDVHVFSMQSRTRIGRRLRTLVLCLVCLGTLPTQALASLDIAPGQTAVVVDTGGDPINLRAEPHTGSPVLATVVEGDVVEVIEGPIQDGGGLWWYEIVASGTGAYIAADFLALGGSEGTPSGVVTGTATVVDTGGDPINCRAGAGAEYSVVATVLEGDAVELAGDRSGPWQPVNCGGQSGFVHTDFLAYATGETDIDFSSSATRARIVNTGGDPINCRAGVGTEFAVLTTFNQGDRVSLAGTLSGDWQPVACAGTTGYVHQAFLSTTTSGGGGGGTITGQGVVANTNGDGVNCRGRASTVGSVIAVISEGTRVDLRGSERNGWQPVVCASRKGYIASDFIEVGDATPPPGGNTDLQPGDDAVVANTGGEGVRLRSRASSTAAVITVLPEDEPVVVRSGSTGDWVAVTYRTSNGYIHMDYLARAGSGDPDPSPGAGLGRNDHARLTDDMNFRSAPHFGSSIIAVLPAGTVVQVTGSADNGFYPVSTAGFEGYLHGDFLVETDEDLTGDDDSGVGGNPGSAPSTAQGRKMIRYATKFLGYPYVWATHGPNTFDCSGFTYYVTIKTLGLDIGAGTWGQSISGTPVAWGDLRPGDLVFFQNTFTWGLSHVGIYIGDGKFIHAENERSGVVVSSLTSTYYKTRWFGARRITTD
jgi:uncharacterized protein YgiM (DUF1202 family)